MQNIHSLKLFPVLLTGVASFIGLTSLFLPDVVASHFDITGTANGFMPRTGYVLFMLFFSTALPSALVVLMRLTLRSPRIRINLPHRDYWLSPERRNDTVEFLCRHMTRFSLFLMIFPAYVHWLVIRANALSIPVFPTLWFIGGLVVFLLTTFLWTWQLLTRFGRIPR